MPADRGSRSVLKALTGEPLQFGQRMQIEPQSRGLIKYFMSRVGLWLLDKLEGLDLVWHVAYASRGPDQGWFDFYIHARGLVARHEAAIQTYRPGNFELTIFTHQSVG